MMPIYKWDNELLERYAHGDLIAMADSPDEARQMLRAELDEWLKENREYEWAEAHGLYGQEKDPEALTALRAKFEADISSEPTAHRTLWIMGSD